MRKELKSFVTEILDRDFPKQSYTVSSSIEELKSWSYKDLKNIISELQQTQKGINKDIMIYIVENIILYYHNIITLEQLISNQFVLVNNIIGD